MKKLMLIVAALFATLTAAAAGTSYVFLAPGFEEVEALTTVDVLRRAKMNVVTVAVSDQMEVTGSTGITVKADSLITEIDTRGAEWLILPGGEEGARNLRDNAIVSGMLLRQAKHDGGIAAICAAPAMVLAPLNLLKGRSCTCYPGLESALIDAGASYNPSTVVVDGELVTSEGPATTLPFAMEIIRLSKGNRLANLVAQTMLR